LLRLKPKPIGFAHFSRLDDATKMIYALSGLEGFYE